MLDGQADMLAPLFFRLSSDSWQRFARTEFLEPLYNCASISIFFFLRGFSFFFPPQKPGLFKIDQIFLQLDVQ